MFFVSLQISICHIHILKIYILEMSQWKLEMFSQLNKKFEKLSKHTHSRIMCMQIAKWPLIVAMLHIVCVCNALCISSTCPIRPNKPLSLLFTSHCLPLHTACACGTFGWSHRVHPGRKKGRKRKKTRLAAHSAPLCSAIKAPPAWEAASDCIPLGLWFPASADDCCRLVARREQLTWEIWAAFVLVALQLCTKP